MADEKYLTDEQVKTIKETLKGHSVWCHGPDGNGCGNKVRFAFASHVTTKPGPILDKILGNQMYVEACPACTKRAK